MIRNKNKGYYLSYILCYEKIKKEVNEINHLLKQSQLLYLQYWHHCMMM